MNFMIDDRLTTDELIDEADRLEDAGFVSEALEYWRSIVKRESDSTLLCRYGRLAMKSKEWVEAKEALLSAVALEPALSAPYNYLGLLYRDQDDLETSLYYFNKSLEVEENERTFTFLGSIQQQLGLIEEAQESFRQALHLNSNYEEAYYNLAVILSCEQPAEAISLLQKAVEIDPEYAIAHRELGWLLRGIDQYPEAEYHLRRAIELDSSNGWAYLYLGNLLWATGDLAAAEQAFKKAIEIWPDGSPSYWGLALFYHHRERTQEAENLYKKALQIDPDDPEANLRFGIYLKDIGKYKKARVYLERALNLDPDNERATTILSELRDRQ